MALLENIGKAIGGVILTLSLISIIFAYGFAQTTSYESLKPVFTDMTASQFSSIGDDQLKMLVSKQCQSADKITMPFDSVELSLNCADAQKSENLTKYISEQLFNAFYYKRYDCSMIDCVKNAISFRSPEDLGVIISAKMNEFLQTLIIYFAAGIILGLLIIILSIRKIFPILKASGMSMIVAGLAFIMLLASKFIMPVNESLLGFVENMMNMFITLYGIVFAIGIVIFIIGWYGNRKIKEPKPRKKAK